MSRGEKKRKEKKEEEEEAPRATKLKNSRK
jgi:hypothetical protein